MPADSESGEGPFPICDGYLFVVINNPSYAERDFVSHPLLLKVLIPDEASSS